MEDIFYKIVSLMSPLLLSALTWALARLAQWASEKVKSEYLKRVILRLDDVILSAVREVEQVFVREIKEAKKDGKLTKEEKRMAQEKALHAAKRYLGQKGIQEILRALSLHENVLEPFLSGRIESTLQRMKSNSTQLSVPWVLLQNYMETHNRKPVYLSQ